MGICLASSIARQNHERAQIMKLRLLVVSLLVAVLIVLLANYFGWQHEAIVISQ